MLGFSSQEIGADQVAADAESEEMIKNSPFSLREYMRRVIQGAANLGRDINVAPKLKDWFIEAGFVDVTVHQILGPYVFFIIPLRYNRACIVALTEDNPG